MTVGTKLKAVLRPLASPLLRRLRMQLDLVLPRIEALEQRLDSLPYSLPSDIMGDDGNDKRSVNNDDLRGSIDNLTRTWLRLKNEVARIASSIPESAAAAAETEVSKLTAQLQASDKRIVAAQSEIAALEVQLRSLMRSTEKRDSRVDDTLRFLLDRVEFVRRETMFELRYGATDRTSSQIQRRSMEARILAPERVNAARVSGSLRLNIGCGHIPESGYINVDMRELPSVDVIAHADNLPFEPGSVDEIFSAHLVEHFPQEEFKRRLLPYWRTLLKPKGRLRAVTPDGEAMLAKMAQGEYRFEVFREVLFGGQDYEGDFHYNLFTPASLRQIVGEAGFTDIDIPVRGRRNGDCFEFELIARLHEPA